MKRWFVVWASASCAPPTKEEAAASRTRDALSRLQSCVMRETGAVELISSCTNMHCEAQRCCNTCSLREARVLNSSGARGVEAGRARDVLELDLTMFDCELGALRGVAKANDPVAGVLG
ncbi:MAG: hypothetical protein ACO1OB_24215 [Archangium sp.]